MAAENFVFNIAKGRVVEYYNRVESNDPAASRLVLVPCQVGGTAVQGRDFDTLAQVIGDANFTERTTGGWVRKSLTDTELASLPTPDDTNDRYDISLPQVTWTTPAAANNVGALLVCYDFAAASADTAIIPLTCHIFAVTTDGNDVILNSGVFFRAS